jgi:hypothetical protein
MPQSRWLPTYGSIDLNFVDLDGDTIVHGTKKELLKLCQKHNFHRASITRYETQLGYGYVIQGSGNRRNNTVCLLTTDMEWRHYRIKPPFRGYEPYTQIWDLAKLLERLAVGLHGRQPYSGTHRGPDRGVPPVAVRSPPRPLPHRHP